MCERERERGGGRERQTDRQTERPGRVKSRIELER